MSTQLRGRRSGPFWSLLFFVTVAALAVGYVLGAQRAGILSIAQSSPVATVALLLMTAVETPTIAVTLTPDASAVQTVVAAQLATALAATLTAQPTPDQAATATREAVLLNRAIAATLTAQPTAIQAPQSLNSPTPISSGIGSNPQLMTAPELIVPEPNHIIGGYEETTFAWKWAGILAPDQGFEILVWPSRQPEDKRGIHDARETQNMTPDRDGIYRLSKYVQNRPAGEYEWTVAIVQLSIYQRIVEASPRSIKITPLGIEEVGNACLGIVQAQAADLYIGPGASYAKVDIVYSGNSLLLIGRTEYSTWFKVQMPESAAVRESWIRADLITVKAGCTLPEIASDAASTSSP